MAETVKKKAVLFLAFLLIFCLPVTAFAEEEHEFDYTVMEVVLTCKTDIRDFITEDNVFDLILLAKRFGYTSEKEDNTALGKVFFFSNQEHTMQIGLDDRMTDDGYKIYDSIRYGKNGYNTWCHFEREDRYDGSVLYSVNVPGSYTVSLDQIVLLTYIMENMTYEEADPLAELFSEYFDFGMYEFPV